MSTLDESNSTNEVEIVLSRVKRVIKSKTDVDVAEALGVSKSNVPTWRKRGTVPYKELVMWAEDRHVSLNWLFYGIPPMGLDEAMDVAAEYEESLSYQPKAVQMQFAHEVQAGYAKLADFELVPRHNATVSGGSGSSITSEQIVDYFAFNKAWLRHRGLQRDNLVLVEVVGDSMSPVLVSGDTVLVDMSQTDLKTGEAYVLRIGDELVVKYAQRLPGNKLRVSSENDRMYPAFEIDLAMLDGEISVIGRVVNSSRNW